jgi:hypothetical protein
MMLLYLSILMNILGGNALMLICYPAKSLRVAVSKESQSTIIYENPCLYVMLNCTRSCNLHT